MAEEYYTIEVLEYKEKEISTNLNFLTCTIIDVQYNKMARYISEKWGTYRHPIKYDKLLFSEVKSLFEFVVELINDEQLKNMFEHIYAQILEYKSYIEKVYNQDQTLKWKQYGIQSEK